MKTHTLSTAAAVLAASSLAANAGSLTFASLTKMTHNGSSFNLSVFDGKASFQPNADTGSTAVVTLGDGTLLDWKLLGGSNINGQAVNDNNEGYTNGPADFINNPTSTNVSGSAPGLTWTPSNWGNVWHTSDPGTDFTANPANQTTYTVLNSGANADPMGPITGTVDIATVLSGQFFFFAGGYQANTDYTVSLSGPGQPELNASHKDVINANNNRVNSVIFEFTNPGGLYDTLTWTYKHNSAHLRGRFMGVALDGVVAGSSTSFPLVITPNSPDSLFKLEWDSQAGMLYRLLSNTGLDTPIDTWTELANDIAATPPTNSYNVDPGDPTLFYAVEEYPAPPVEIFSENFDGAAGPGLPADWTTGTNPADNSSLTSWEVGTPANVGPVPPGVPLPSAANCVATNIMGNYDDPVSDLGVAHTDIWLRTPAIDLGAATAGTLTFQQWTQIEDVPGDLDYGSIRILDASDDSELAVMENRTIDGNTSGWEEYSMDLPAEAFTATAGTIKVELRFEADDIDSFAGWYIDDVTVTVPGS